MGLGCAALLINCCCSQLNYTRPGLPKLNPRLLENWKNEVKEKGRINCPNNVRIVCSSVGWLVSICRRKREVLGQKPTKNGSYWASDHSDAQTLISPAFPELATVSG